MACSDNAMPAPAAMPRPLTTNAPPVPFSARYMGWLILAVLGMLAFSREWLGQERPFYNSALGNLALLASLGFAVYFLVFLRPWAGRQARMARLAPFLLLYGLLTLTILFERAWWVPGDLPTNKEMLRSYLLILCAPIWGWVGFWYAARPAHARWLLERLAACGAIGAAVSFILFHLGFNGITSPGAADWPMRLIFLFSYFWYLYRWLHADRMNWWALAGFLASSMEILLMLHKPIIACAAVGMVALLFLMVRSERHTGLRAVRRIVVLSLAGAVLMVAVNVATNGLITDTVEHFVYERVFHLSFRPKLSDLNSELMLDLASGGRFYVWKESLSMAAASPWLGSGFGRKLEAQTVAETDLSVHNLYLEFLLGVGICGLAILLINIWIWFAAILRHLRHLHPDTRAGIITIACYAIALLAYNMGGIIIWFIGPTYVAVFLAGIALRLAQRDTS
ncbi:MAG: O-Antigen ligase [bacterium ADurb.Bin429]|nr:MAG: O-Antigen ligase [bacterium ADurb.Bin429]